jgi:hypothetical protein
VGLTSRQILLVLALFLIEGLASGKAPDRD